MNVETPSAAPEVSRGRRVAAMLASLSAPGAGMFVLGRWGRGAAWAVSSVILFAVAYVGFRVHPPLLLAGLFLGPIVSIACLVDTFRVRPGRVLPGTAVAVVAWLGLLVAGSVPGTLFRAYLVEAFKIPSGGMQPTLEVGDHVFVDKAAYVRALPARGDVVVFENPQDRTKQYAKRIAGLPGDTLLFRNGMLEVDGEAQGRTEVGRVTVVDATCEPAVLDRFDETLAGVTHGILQRRAQSGFSGGPFVVPAGEYFVLGDNRDNSMDSSRAGYTVPLDHVVGRVSFVWLSLGPCDGGVRTERFGLLVR